MNLVDWIGAGCIAALLSLLGIVEVRHYRRNKHWVETMPPFDWEKD